MLKQTIRLTLLCAISSTALALPEAKLPEWTSEFQIAGALDSVQNLDGTTSTSTYSIKPNFTVTTVNDLFATATLKIGFSGDATSITPSLIGGRKFDVTNTISISPYIGVAFNKPFATATPVVVVPVAATPVSLVESTTETPVVVVPVEVSPAPSSPAVGAAPGPSGESWWSQVLSNAREHDSNMFSGLTQANNVVSQAAVTVEPQAVVAVGPQTMATVMPQAVATAAQTTTTTNGTFSVPVGVNVGFAAMEDFNINVGIEHTVNELLNMNVQQFSKFSLGGTYKFQDDAMVVKSVALQVGMSPSSPGKDKGGIGVSLALSI